MEQLTFWMQIVISILSGLVALIPLIIKLVEYVKLAIKEKNWNILIKIVMNLMEDAEQLYERGADKKDYVMKALEEVSGTINFDIDYDIVSDMIDSICDTSKVINAK